MGVKKTLIYKGNGVDKPNKGDQINLLYTGYLYDPDKTSNECKGEIFDSTKTRGEFMTQIGAGKVIKGLDEGIIILDGGMSLGEKATLTISSDYAYGSSGFPGFVPPNTWLIFVCTNSTSDVELKAINGKRA